MNNKILIITRHFIPYHHSLGTIIRMLKLAEFLKKNGFQVYILAAKGVKQDYFGYEDLAKNLNIIYVDDLIQSAFNKFRSQPKTKKPVNPAKNLLAVILEFFYQMFREISIPDPGRFAANKFYKFALKIIIREGIENVLVTSPPHSTQIIGYKLKKTLKDKIKLFIDYRDSWNNSGEFKKHTPLTCFFSERLERKILKICDHFIYVSSPILSKINKKYFDISAKSLLVMNGYDLAMISQDETINSGDNSLKIGYFGRLSSKKDSYSNPDLLFKSLAGLKRDIKLIFYGPVDIAKSWQDKLKSKIVTYNSVPHQESLRLMKKMDLLLVFFSQTDGSDEVVTTKIFEYMLAGKPILVIGPKDMEAMKIVEKEKIGYCLDLYNQTELLEGLNRIFKLWKENNLLSYDINRLKLYSRQHQYLKLLDLLKA